MMVKNKGNRNDFPFFYFVVNCLLIIKNKIMENNKKVIITGATGMLGKAMIGTLFSPFDKLHIENSDINNYSEK